VFIEEVIPPTGPPSTTEHNPLTIPKNWNSRASYGSPGPHQPVNEEPGPSASIEEWPYTPCYVVEEIPPEATEATENTGQEHQRHQSKEAAEGASKEHAASYSQEQPPTANWDLLNLIFDIRGKMEDHIFRLAQIDQRLDMFFAAHSRATSKKQCPTCARTYTFPARWRHSDA
jgi:hypothetical protein